MSPKSFTQGHSMKTEWLIADVTAARSPDRAERAVWGGFWLGAVLDNSGRNHGQGIDSLVANVTAVGSPDRGERAILGLILAGCFFGRFRPYFVVREPLCHAGTPF